MASKSIFARFRWFFCRLWLCGGVISLAAAIYFSARVGLFLQESAQTEGTITQMFPERQDDGTINYAAEFSFATPDGKNYIVNAGVATNPPEFEVGERVRVLYRESNPANAKIDTFWQLWFETVLGAGLGIFFVLAGGLLFQWERRSKKKKALTSAAA